MDVQCGKVKVEMTTEGHLTITKNTRPNEVVW